eukprot:gene3174-66705_t
MRGPVATTTIYHRDPRCGGHGGDDHLPQGPALRGPVATTTIYHRDPPCGGPVAIGSTD